jgi:peptidoglycan/LPS O-acetylase OafA/YrhL
VLATAAIGPTRDKDVAPLEWLGDFSYSLYLMHPVALALTLRALPQGAIPGLAALVVDIAAAVAFSRVFFHLVERHFLNTPPRVLPKS